MENENKTENPSEQDGSASLVERAESVAARMEAANKRSEELLLEHEKVVAKQLLGGKSEAGTPAPAPVVETSKEYAEKVMSGKIKPV